MSVEMMMLQRFPILSAKMTQELIRAADIRLLILDPKADTVYCTRCGKYSDAFNGFRHSKELHCPACGALCEVVSNHYKWNSQVRRRERNIAAIIPAENERPDPEKRNCYITVVKITVHYIQRMTKPVINVTEHQRYIFTPDGKSIRYGRYLEWFRVGNKWYREMTDWKHMSRFEEPVFDGTKGEGYEIYGMERLKETCLRYSAAELIEFGDGYYNAFSLLKYLKFYNRHRGVERLIRAGFKDLVRQEMRSHNRLIDWKQTEPHRMLGLTRPEARAVAAGELDFYERRWLHELLPNTPPAQLERYNGVVSSCYRDDVERILRRTGADPKNMLKYLAKRPVFVLFYVDYIRECRELGYDFTDKDVLYPSDLKAAHARTTAALNALRDEKEAARLKELEKAYAKMRRNRKKLEFSNGELFVRQPADAAEIIAEGKALSHCVGGYAERHVKGELTIMLLRRKSDPDTPYYTIEVSKGYKLIQCRGYKNNWVDRGGKPKEQEIIDFEELYEQHLDHISGRGKAKVKVSA